jgi:predicted ArsR family transcriptional regulator
VDVGDGGPDRRLGRGLLHLTPLFALRGAGFSTTGVGRIPLVVSQPASVTPASHAGAERSLTPEEFTAAVAAVTSAFGDPTRRDIYLFVRTSAEGVTASEVAEHFELHPNVARHHLEKLTGGGYVTVAIAKAQGTRPAGRPSKRYRATDADHALALPLKHDDVLASLLVRALDTLGPEQAEVLADEVGYDYGRTLAARMEPGTGHRSARTAVAAVADALTAHGFAAHAEGTGDELSIVSECCPFGETAQRYPHVVCALDRGMIRGMLAGLYGETSPHFAASRPDGDAHCVARV